MQRTARLVLRRINQKGKRVRISVKVQRITLGGFLELVRAMAPKAAAAMVAAGRALTMPELLRCCGDSGALAFFADLVCPGRPVGFIRKWCPNRPEDTPEGALAYRNTAALLAASRAVEGEGQWTRYLDTLQKPPAASAPPLAPGGAVKRQKGGGLMADALLIARTFGVLPDVVKAMALRDFLDLCDAMNGEIERAENDPDSASYDPTLDPNAEPTPIH